MQTAVEILSRAEMAIRFEKAFGVLMRMQATFKLAEARRRESEIQIEAA
jgi:plasmid maintenance system antidote protein VapI